MSLSEHEETQFRLLTADLMLDDSALKTMENRDKATAMSYMALPHTTTILMVLGIIASIFTGGCLLADHTVVGSISGVFSMVIFLGAAMRLEADEANYNAARGK